MYFTYCPVQIYKIMFRRFLFSRIWPSAQDYAVLGLLLSPVGFWISTWQNLSGGNDLYWRCTSFEKAFRRGRPLNILHDSYGRAVFLKASIAMPTDLELQLYKLAISPAIHRKYVCITNDILVYLSTWSFIDPEVGLKTWCLMTHDTWPHLMTPGRSSSLGEYIANRNGCFLQLYSQRPLCACWYPSGHHTETERESDQRVIDLTDSYLWLLVSLSRPERGIERETQAMTEGERERRRRWQRERERDTGDDRGRERETQAMTEGETWPINEGKTWERERHDSWERERHDSWERERHDSWERERHDSWERERHDWWQMERHACFIFVRVGIPRGYSGGDDGDKQRERHACGDKETVVRGVGEWWTRERISIYTKVNARHKEYRKTQRWMKDAKVNARRTRRTSCISLVHYSRALCMSCSVILVHVPGASLWCMFLWCITLVHVFRMHHITMSLAHVSGPCLCLSHASHSNHMTGLLWHFMFWSWLVRGGMRIYPPGTGCMSCWIVSCQHPFSSASISCVFWACMSCASSTIQTHTAMWTRKPKDEYVMRSQHKTILCRALNTLHYTPLHCNTLQCTATHYTLQHTVAHWWTQHATTHCNTLNALQHIATHCNTDTIFLGFVWCSTQLWGTWSDIGAWDYSWFWWPRP